MTNANDQVYPDSIATDQFGNVYKAENYSNQAGLTKREYFAAMALQGMLSMVQRWPADGRRKLAKESV